MNCACIQNHFDLSVRYLDCKTIVIEDHSKWITDTGYDVPEVYDLIVTIPSRASEITIQIQTGKRNTFSTVDFFGTTESLCFPDEIYCFSTESCGIKYTISRAFLCTLECRITSLISMAQTDEDFHNVLSLQTMLDGIRINAELGKVETARDLYNLLKSKVEHLDCGHCGC